MGSFLSRVFGTGPPSQESFSLEKVPPQTNKVVIITGGTAGLGLESAVSLVARGAHVIITARSHERGQQALHTIQTRASQCHKQLVATNTTTNNTNNTASQFDWTNVPLGKVEYAVADNTDLKSIRAFAESFLSRNLPLHVLMLNAGIPVMAHGLIALGASNSDDANAARTEYEQTFVVNHVAHHYLTRLLEPALKRQTPSRVVVVSSKMSEFVRKEKWIDWHQEAVTPKHKYAPPRAYAVSKLANILHAKELARRLGAQNIYANSCHPGLVATEIVKKMTYSGFVASLMRLIDLVVPKLTAEQGQLTQLYLATSDDVINNGWNGEYFVPTAQRVVLKPNAKDLVLRVDVQEALWDETEKILEQSGVTK